VFGFPKTSDLRSETEFLDTLKGGGLGPLIYLIFDLGFEWCYGFDILIFKYRFSKEVK
jgi:hypothetical protein